MTETTPPADGVPSGDLPATPPASPAPAPGRGGKRGLVIGASAAVLAVVAGAAVYATTALSGGGRQPDELVPKSAFAYVKIDLDPAANQKLAARSFFGKFPSLKGKADGDDPVEGVLGDVLSDDDLSFERDVKPWFDRRAAIAVFPGANGRTETVAVLRSKDDGKAKAALDRVKASGDAKTAYTITKGYVVVSDEQAAVDDAVRLSAQASLKDNDVYKGDVAKLPGDQIAVGWVDVAQAFQAAKNKIPLSSTLPSGLTDLVKGRIALGVHLSNDYVEVQGRAFGVDQRVQPKATDHAVLKALPANTFAALSSSGVGDQLKNGLAQAGGAGGLDPAAIIAGVLGESGLSLDDDVLPLFGEQSVFVLGTAFTGLDSLRAALVTRVADPAKAQAAGPKVAAAVTQFGVPVTSTLKGNTFYLGTGDYPAQLAAGSGLGDSAKFTKATGDLAGAGVVAYVDLEAAVAANPKSSPRLKPLRSAGLVTGTADGQPFFRLRVVAA
ncbi:MAG TPA: DUF3352 domain-containing protein [Mycobacteriales bacterium]|jgi:hypothetical protein|nr:DUF3352 domain-containing protein [Mycobacteriales bacterium]